MIKEHSTRVEQILRDYSNTKDDDGKLFALFIKSYIMAEHSLEILKAMKAEDLLNMMADGKLPKLETVSRCRRLLQEKNPELRGKMYNKRKGIEEEVKAELDYVQKNNIPGPPTGLLFDTNEFKVKEYGRQT